MDEGITIPDLLEEKDPGEVGEQEFDNALENTPDLVAKEYRHRIERYGCQVYGEGWSMDEYRSGVDVLDLGSAPYDWIKSSSS